MTNGLNENESFHRSRAGNALKWNTVLASSAQLTGLVVGVVLARILPPSDFGLLAMITVFTGFASILVDAGTGSSVIQKSDLNKEDLNSIFYFNLVISFVLSFVIFLLAVPISKFYDEPRLLAIIHVVAWQPLVASFSVVPRNLLARNMSFKKQTIGQLSGQISGGVVGITMAYKGFGVWALVTSTYTVLFLSNILFWLQAQWKPSFLFSYNSFKSIWPYSSNILATNLTQEIIRKVDVVLIGKFVNPTTLGLYSKSKSLAGFPTIVFSQVFSRSFFPFFSRIQSNRELFKTNYIEFSKILFWFSLPVFILLVIASKEIIYILLGERWLPAALLFSLSAILGIFNVNAAFGSYALNAIGKPKYSLKRSLTLSPLRVMAYLILALFSKELNPSYLLIIAIIISFFGFFWLQKDIDKELGVTILHIGKMAIIPLLSSIICAIFYFKTKLFFMEPIVKFLVGTIVYVFFLFFFAVITGEYKSIKSILMSLFNKEQKVF